MEFVEICNLLEKLTKTTKRLEKTEILSDFLKKNNSKEVFELLTSSFETLGVSIQYIIKSLAVATGYSIKEINNVWKKTGDIGDAAENLIKKKKQNTLFTETLSIKYVLNTVKKLPKIEGHGSVERKIKLIANLLTSSKGIEAKYIIRILLDDLRVGLGEGTIRDAISKALNIDKDIIEEAYNKILDFSELYEIGIKEGEKGLKDLKLKIGRPVRVMLYQKALDIKDAFERVGKPAAFEYKYDGFRMIAEKKKDKIIIFTRRLEEVTEQFPDVVEYLKNNIKADECILDGEAVGFINNKYRPFQEISQRIRRKHNIEELAKKLPVELNLFDIMHLNGKDMLSMPFLERRKALEKIVDVKKGKINLSTMIITEKEEEAEKFYKKALSLGFEGVMAKNLKGIYKPGSRVGYGVKVKPIMEPLDVVIVEAEWGEGKRGKWLSSYTIAIQDKGELLTIGKVSSGLKEIGEKETYEEMTKKLMELKIKEEGRTIKVKPKIILEVAYEEIQKSPTYSSGYALRFPRILRLREDKPLNEISDLALVESLFLVQKKKSHRNI